MGIFDGNCDQNCFGQALNETLNWYSDDAFPLTADTPWITRGGTCAETSLNLGIYSVNPSKGYAYIANTFRITLITQ